MAHWTKSTTWANTAQNLRIPNFMYNQEVTKNVTAWQYNPQKYWPGNGDKVSFFAYAPYTASPAAVSSGASGVIELSLNSVAGEPWLKFEVGADVSKHQDLMYAKAMDKTSAGGAVNLEFQHALSQVAFKAVAWEADGALGDNNTTVTINSVTLKTNRKSATLNLSTGAWSDAQNGSSQIAYTLSTANGHLANNVFTGGTSVTNRIMPDNDYILMFPNLAASGATGDQYSITVDYTIETKDSKVAGGKITDNKSITKTITPGFAAGKYYTITIHLGMNEGPNPSGMISFTATCADWGSENSVSVQLGE